MSKVLLAVKRWPIFARDKDSLKKKIKNNYLLESQEFIFFQTFFQIIQKKLFVKAVEICIRTLIKLNFSFICTI